MPAPLHGENTVILGMNRHGIVNHLCAFARAAHGTHHKVYAARYNHGNALGRADRLERQAHAKLPCNSRRDFWFEAVYFIAFVK